MTYAQDFSITISIQLFSFGVGCYVAWRTGRKLDAQQVRVLRLLPWLFVGGALLRAMDAIDWSHRVYYRSMSLHAAGDAAAFLVAAGLLFLYSKIAPRIFEIGAKRHPKAKVIPNAVEIRERRRIAHRTYRRAVPLYAIGMVTGIITSCRGYQAQDFNAAAIGLLSALGWPFIVSILVEIQCARLYRRTISSPE